MGGSAQGFSMNDTLTAIESRLQNLIEGSLKRLFTANGAHPGMPARLVAAMRAGMRLSQDGQAVAPNLYVLVAHPGQAADQLSRPELHEQWIEILQEVAAQGGLVFASRPVLRVQEDPSLPPDQIDLFAHISGEKLAQTTELEVEASDAGASTPPNAFLIVDGVQTIPLTRPVVNIGRRPDNHLVIADPRISRIHAQLRAVRGRFMLFDLESTGGTFVNGQPVHHIFLQPGDVISLAGVPLVYSQDPCGPSETQQVQLNPPAETL